MATVEQSNDAIQEIIGGWLSTAQAARAADRSEQLIRQLMRSGELPSVRTSIGRLVRPQDLQRFLETRKRREGAADAAQ